MTKTLFDFRYLDTTCQYPVTDRTSPEGESPCDEFAVALGWWGEEDEGWHLCQEHLDFIREHEEVGSL